MITKPKWLRIKMPLEVPVSQSIDKMKNTLCTVCVEAQCPNLTECFSKGTATFMLLGPNCSRRCSFCAVDKGRVSPLNPNEPDLIAEAISQMDVQYCVLTMVTRDDLSDGGACHIQNTVLAIRKRLPKIRLELLISDLSGNWDALKSVLQTAPQVLNHNIETINRLYPTVRPQASYTRSLELLRKVKELTPAVVTKSSLMLGLGESPQEVYETMDDLLMAGCNVLTMGQYLAPSKKHLPVVRYVHPDEFEGYRIEALKRGFMGVASAPLVRSSYKAEELYYQAVGLLRN
ncbi:lipoyl synthase [Desulfopila sp. IMCC35008]|uniref:lipoyl synthase n=1 Tax=Desulfopila sp. IMCC35008 TaxID=2653858 RepID=UPI00197A7784|nr:lipoyl synthase [Desulfopila sp. IMCC35008]